MAFGSNGTFTVHCDHHGSDASDDFCELLFVTPIYFGSWTFLGVREWLNLSSFGLSGTGTYLTTILIVYVPFNILKGAAVMSVYFVIARAIQTYLGIRPDGTPV